MFAATVAVARILGRTGYGELGMIQSTVGMFGVFAGFGLGITAIKHVAEYYKIDPEKAGRIIGLSGLVAAVAGGMLACGLLVFAPWLAEHTLNAPHLAGVIRIGSVILLLSAYNGAQIGALSGLEAFKSIAGINLINGLLSFPMLIGGAYFGGLTGTISAMAVNSGFNCILSHAVLRGECRRSGIPVAVRYCGREIPILWRFSLPAVLSGAMVMPVHWICQTLLVNQPDGYNELGILTAALVFQQVLLFISGMIAAPLLAMISNAGEQIAGKLGIVNILSSWILGVIAAIPLLCFPEAAQVIFGDAYNNYSFKVVLSFVVLCTSVITFKEGLARVLSANSLLWWGFFSNALWAALLIISTVYLVNLGAAGLSAALLIAYVINTVILLPLYYYRNLVPGGTLLSFESAVIWGILFGLVLMNINNTSIATRSIVFLPCMGIAGVTFLRIYRSVKTIIV